MAFPKLPPLDLRSATRQSILDYFNETYALYERLFEPLCEKAFYTRADSLRHPLIFYYAHTAVLFVNKFIVARIIKDRIDPKLESMCAVGVDEMSWDDISEKTYDWPSVATVTAYRKSVRRMVADVIANLPEPDGQITWKSPWWVVLLGIDHEKIHLETSSVLIRQLPLDLLTGPKSYWPVCPVQNTQAPVNSLLTVPGGHVELGRSASGPQAFYGWDGEYGHLSGQVAEFRASKYVVSNEEFRAFVEAGGYTKREFWNNEGWAWVSYDKCTMPRFWRRGADGEYRLRLMLEEIAMPWAWPVEVNQLEAAAFCAWRGGGARLPTELEWMRLATHAGIAKEPAEVAQPGYPADANIELRRYASSVPVDDAGTSEGGFIGVVGNVWQWTSTPVDGFPGFKPHEVYDDFSLPTFDRKHNVIRGGSWVSMGNSAQATMNRYAFRRHFYQHAGFRYVEGPGIQAPEVSSEEEDEQLAGAYETDEMASMYLEFQWGPPTRIPVQNFAVRCAEICREMYAKHARCGSASSARMLDLGCATGRTALELTRAGGFGEVIGSDFSVRFMRLADRLLEKGRIRYRVAEEGRIFTHREANWERRPGDAPARFIQGDACNLDPAKFNSFGMVFAGNLLCRLHDPRGFLARIGSIIVPGGLLVMTTPASWDPSYTAVEQWVGGYRDEKTGENVRTIDGLRTHLAADFEEVEEPFDTEFVIRVHARRHEHTFALTSVWRRRGAPVA